VGKMTIKKNNALKITRLVIKTSIENLQVFVSNVKNWDIIVKIVQKNYNKMPVLDVNNMVICQKVVQIREFVEILYLYFINQNY
jgi:hypothetical protein